MSLSIFILLFIFSLKNLPTASVFYVFQTSLLLFVHMLCIVSMPGGFSASKCESLPINSTSDEKNKDVYLWDSITAPLAIADLAQSSEYDVYKLSGHELGQLPEKVMAYTPDLLVCEDRFFELLLRIEPKLPKRLPFIIIGAQVPADSTLNIPNRPVAYLYLPFEFNMLDAMIKCLF